MSIAEHALPDNILLEQISKGDTYSFDTLFYRYYNRVYGILFRLVGNRSEAEDLTQEVFLKLYENPPRQKRDHHIGAWLYRVATNSGYNFIRGRKRLWQRNVWLVPGADRSESSPELDNPAQKIESAETKAQVREALAQLKPQQGQLLLLRQMGLSYAELAEACEIAPSSVGTLLARAGKAFQQVYEKSGGE